MFRLTHFLHLSCASRAWTHGVSRSCCATDSLASLSLFRNGSLQIGGIRLRVLKFWYASSSEIVAWYYWLSVLDMTFGGTVVWRGGVIVVCFFQSDSLNRPSPCNFLHAFRFRLTVPGVAYCWHPYYAFLPGCVEWYVSHVALVAVTFGGIKQITTDDLRILIQASNYFCTKFALY